MADDGHNLHVLDTGGDGRPVVLIHGWPLSGESWSDQVGPLTDAGYRVVRYDRRGFGRSDPGDSYDYDALADDLKNVIDDLDLSDVTIVGFSMGGGEVARYIARHGEEQAAQRGVRRRGAAVPAEERRQPRRPARRRDRRVLRGRHQRRPRRLLRRVHHRLLLRRRRAEGHRGAAPGRARDVQAVRRAGRSGRHGGVRQHRLPRRPHQGHRAHAGPARRLATASSPSRARASAPTRRSRAASSSSSRAPRTGATSPTPRNSTPRC